MKLKRFNQENSAQVKTGKPTVRISRKSGLIAFSKAASEMLQLSDKSRVELLQNEEEPADWYVLISNSENAFQLRGSKQQFSFNSSHLARRILDSTGVDKSTAFMISREPLEENGEKLWYMITGNKIGAR